MNLKDKITAELEIITAQQANSEPGVVSEEEQEALGNLHRLAMGNRGEYERMLDEIERERPDLGINNQPIIGAALEAFGKAIED
jgi:hypothetical protein